MLNKELNEVATKIYNQYLEHALKSARETKRPLLDYEELMIRDKVVKLAKQVINSEITLEQALTI